MKKTANALSQESDLLNIHSDYKAVASKFDSLVKTQEEASKRLLKWAEGKVGASCPSPRQAGRRCGLATRPGRGRAGRVPWLLVQGATASAAPHPTPPMAWLGPLRPPRRGCHNLANPAGPAMHVRRHGLGWRTRALR